MRLINWQRQNHQSYRLRRPFADDPQSVDEMREEVMKDRAAHPFNQRFGKENFCLT